MNEKPPTEWEALYQSGETPWNKGEASPGLVDYLSGVEVPGSCEVLVPGCGLGHDVRAFANHGWSATGFDIAPTAMRKAAEQSSDSNARIEFRVGDFLRDAPHRHYDLIFEHTLFCAIDPGQRDNYVQAVRRWLRPGGQFLAVYYMIDDVDGPPFGVTREEISERFSPTFSMTREWVPRSYPHREGLEWMVLWQG